MSNSTMGYAPPEQLAAPESLFSTDAARRKIELDLVDRFFARVRVPTTGAGPAHLHGLVDALDSGGLDNIVEQFDKDAAPAIPLEFDEVPEFDYDAWRKRHR